MSNPAADVFDQWAQNGKDVGIELEHMPVLVQKIGVPNSQMKTHLFPICQRVRGISTP